MITVPIIFMLVSLALVAGSLFFLFRKRSFLKNAHGVPGTITHIGQSWSVQRDARGFRDKIYYPTVRFQTRAGEVVEHTPQTFTKHFPYRVGQTVQANYVFLVGN